MIRTYSELSKLETFEDRFNYLKVEGSVGIDTFGFDRYLNQALYRTSKWKKVRDQVIIRDRGCDLGVADHEIYKGIIIHHMNPITKRDILNEDPNVYDPEFLICTCLNTHNAIHFSNESILLREPIERKKGDTCPWR